MTEPLLLDGPLPYLLSVPPARGEGPVPVLCFLHGRDEAAPAPIRGAMDKIGPFAASAASEARRDFVVVAPQLTRAGDRWLEDAAAVTAIVEEVQRTHGGDAARTYLTGFSFGGNGVFDLAAADPGRWAALWAVDPTRVPRTDSRRPVWLSAGELARGIAAPLSAALGLEEAEGEPEGERVWLDEGADHVGSATLAYGDARIYRWLLRYARPGQGREVAAGGRG